MLAACAHTRQPPPPVTRREPPPSPAAEPVVYLDQVVAALRDGYVASCRERTSSAPYCDCAFGQLQAALMSAEEPEPFPPTDPRAVQLEQDIHELCTNLLPQEEIEAAFMANCGSQDPRKQPYCQCAWANLSQQNDADHLVGSIRALRFRAEMALACRGQYPAQLARDDFMKQCTEGHAEADRACACKWEKLTQRYTVEQIVAEVAEPRHVSGLRSCDH